MNSNLLRGVLKMMNGKISGNFSKEEEKTKLSPKNYLLLLLSR